MGSGARLRSQNQAFGRSRTDAFLITFASEPDVYFCQCTGVVQDLFRQVNPSGEATTGSNCQCGNWPTNQDFSKELRFAPSMNGLGWEDPPFPAFRITGDISGAVITCPVHCAVQGCLPEGPIQWGRYAITLGVAGVDFAVVVPNNTDGDIPVNFRYVYGYWDAAGSPPFIADESCTWEIEYTSQVLPDPGPYTIVGARDDPQFSGFALFELDRPPRYTTRSAVNIQGTGLYDGVWEARRYNDHPSQGPNEILVEVAYAGPVVIGTLTRLFDAAYDCWANGCGGAKPPLPTP